MVFLYSPAALRHSLKFAVQKVGQRIIGQS